MQLHDVNNIFNDHVKLFRFYYMFVITVSLIFAGHGFKNKSRHYVDLMTTNS